MQLLLVIAPEQLFKERKPLLLDMARVKIHRVHIPLPLVVPLEVLYKAHRLSQLETKRVKEVKAQDQLHWVTNRVEEIKDQTQLQLVMGLDKELKAINLLLLDKALD
jgi:hypothetical protein